MRKKLAGSSSWQSVLGSPPRASHILQLYDSDDFLSSAVAHFAAEGLKNGEAMLLTGTKDHLAQIDRELRSAAIDVDSAQRSGQLMPADVHEALAHVVPDGRLDPARFEAIACATLEQARSDARFSGVRWWGEMTNTLNAAGGRQAGLEAEKLADAAARKYGATVFCSYLCDKFDPVGYDETLTELCCVHSHVIPAEDYVQHRLAVNRAIADVVGDLNGTLLQSLSSWKGYGCDLPSSQALLFWLRETMPHRFEAVLARARDYALSEETPDER